MRFLYVSHGDFFNRHELGFAAALAELGSVDVLDLKVSLSTRVIRVGSDNEVKSVNLVGSSEPVSIKSLFLNWRLSDSLRRLIKDEYDVIFAAPRVPIFFLRRLGMKLPVVLRLWSIRAAKFRDNIRFGSYEDIAIFIPSVMANMTYMAMANASISVDHATYEFARKIYPILRRRLFKLYPPYGYLVQDEPNKIDELALAKLDRIKDDYVLGFTSLSKTGAYLKFEARPHAIVLYLIAKRLRNINVVMAGSSLNDWNRVFPGIKPPPNLHLIDGGFSDKILGTLYSRARLVIIPITNRSISNRLLEALFFSKAVITSEVVKFIHPELRHKEHVYISNWDTIVEDTIKLMNDWDMIKRLEKGAREAYVRYFSTKINLRFVDKLLKAFDIV